LDPDIAALASAAATAVVTAMAKESWERVSGAVARLWRGASAQRVEHVRTALEHSRQDLVESRSDRAADDDIVVEAELVAEWQGKLRRLLAEHPEIAAELRQILELDAEPAAGVRFGSVTHQGVGDINQAAGDIHVVRGRADP
jgi:hypothetical protein